MTIEFYLIDKPKMDKLLDSLIKAWERSVRTTHHFLMEQDIQKLIPLVRKRMKSTALFVLNDNKTPVSFGRQDRNIVYLARLFQARGGTKTCSVCH